MIIDAAPTEKKADYDGPIDEGFIIVRQSDSILKALERQDLKDRFLLAVGKTEWENMKMGRSVNRGEAQCHQLMSI